MNEHGTAYTVDLLRDDAGSDRERWETDLVAAGAPLPLTHRRAWAKAGFCVSSWFLGARDEQGRACGGIAIDVSPSRALPGHLLLRADRLSVVGSPAPLRACLAALGELARRERRILRVNVELFGREPRARDEFSSLLKHYGFFRLTKQRMYEETLVMDLAGDEASLFKSLSASARRNVRELAKQPYSLRVIDDPALGNRLNALLTSVMERRGGMVEAVDWSRAMELSRESPDSSRLVGIFRDGLVGGDALVGFAWGRAHGDHVEYYLGAAARQFGERLAPGYPLLWDLIAWAKRIGATWFDFGGVTAGSHETTDDKLGGISDFKRFFSRTVASVSEEWQLDPHPTRAALAVAISRGARWIAESRQRFLDTKPRRVLDSQTSSLPS